MMAFPSTVHLLVSEGKACWFHTDTCRYGYDIVLGVRNSDICIGTEPRSYEDLLAIDPVKGGGVLGLRSPFSAFFLSPWLISLSARIFIDAFK